MFGSLKRRKAQKERAEALYWACVEQARTPAFYTDFGVPDTLDGRFELITLHAGLLIRRLNAEGETGKAVPVGFSYTSENNTLWLEPQEILDLIRETGVISE